MTKHKYCSECLRELKPEEMDIGICKWCKDIKVSYGNKSDYNYYTDRNPKSSWDDQAPYSDDYTDQYDW